MPLGRSQYKEIAAALVGTCDEPDRVARELFGHEWGEIDAVGLEHELGVFRCEECLEWFDGHAGTCRDCAREYRQDEE